MMLEHQLTIEHRVSANESYDRYIGVHGSMPEVEGVLTMACQGAANGFIVAEKVWPKSGKQEGA